MNRHRIHAALDAALAAAALALVTAPAVTLAGQPRTQMLEEDRPNIWAKVANERAKGNARKGTDGFNDEDGCGGIDIGNVDASAANSRSRAPRENTVVITGDVINAPGGCKKQR